MKKPCSNHPKYMYSGKESSPLGLGLAAEPFIVGTIKEGRDKTNWIICEKNGIKVWSRITRLSEMRGKDDENKDQETPVVKKKITRAKKAAKENVNPEPKKEKPTAEKDEDNDHKEEDNGSLSDTSSSIMEEMSEEVKEKAKPGKRKPTKYNIYMRYKLKLLAKEGTNLKPSERIRYVVAEWKSMTDQQKDEVVEKALKMLENEEE